MRRVGQALLPVVLVLVAFSSTNTASPARAQSTPVIMIAASPATVTEGDAITITLTANPPPSETITVKFRQSLFNRYSVHTYTRTLRLSSGASTETVDVRTYGDSIDEPDGDVVFNLEEGTGYTIGNPASTTVRVEDDDPAPTEAPTKVPTVSIARGVEELVVEWCRVAGATDYKVQWKSGTQSFDDAATDNREAIAWGGFKILLPLFLCRRLLPHHRPDSEHGVHGAGDRDKRRR